MAVRVLKVSEECHRARAEAQTQKHEKLQAQAPLHLLGTKVRPNLHTRHQHVASSSACATSPPRTAEDVHEHYDKKGVR